MGLNLDRLTTRVTRAVARSEREYALEMRAYIQTAHARLQEDLRRGWPDRLRESSRVWREARARELLAQVQPALDALRLDNEMGPAFRTIQAAIDAGTRLEAEQSRAIFEAYARSSRDGRTAAEIREFITGPRVPWGAIEDQTRNFAQGRNTLVRLHNYTEEAFQKINTAVVNGLVRGDGYRKVAREVRRAVIGEPVGRGGLAYQAETIARTELLSSLNEAKRERFAEDDIEQVVWIATADERVCDVCAARSGNVYALAGLILPAHPRCRCTTIPFKQQWVDEGILDMEDLDRHRADVQAEFEAAHEGDGRVFAVKPSPFERSAGVSAPEPLNARAEREIAAQAAVPEPEPWQPLAAHEADLRLLAEFPENSWPHDHRGEVERYTGSTYMYTNDHLRGNLSAGDYELEVPGGARHIAVMDEALAGKVAPVDAELWRGYSFESAKLPDDPADAVGTVFADNGFVSTSVTRAVAEDFAHVRYSQQQTHEAVLVRVKARAGRTRGAYVQPISSIPGEDEFLMPRGTAFRVMDARFEDVDGTRIRMLTVEVEQ